MNNRGSVFDVFGYVGPVESWKALGVAIVRQAIFDWEDAMKAIEKRGDATRMMLHKKNETERFLVSDTCELYCGCDGKTIVRRLKDEFRRKAAA